MRQSSEVLNGILAILFLPERQVLLEKFDDGLCISEGLLVNIVDFLEGL